MNWQVVPIPPWKCTFRPQLFVVVAVLNIITDAALLIIPIPMLVRLKIPLRKKLVISLVLSSGLFVITAAIIRVVYSLDAEPSASNINRWGVRETIIGIIAIHIPILRPLFNRSFWVWGPYDPRVSKTSSNTGSRSWPKKRQAGSDSSSGDLELGTSSRSSHPDNSRSSSQERIRDWDGKDNSVFVETTYDVTSHERAGEELGTEIQAQSWNSARLPH